MHSSLLKVIATLAIFIGEFLAIYAEIRGAHNHGILTRSFTSAFIPMFVVMTIGGAFLVGGYILGYRSFGNIWIVAVISIASILITEPIIGYGIFRELPTPGAWVGLGLGIAGLVAALFF